MTDNDAYYVVLHGAKKNVGDFLIRARAKALLQQYRPDRRLVEFEGWKSLEQNLEVINGAKALIIMGGPGIQYQTYPKIYPLTQNLDAIKVPICMLGSGSFVKPGSIKAIAMQKFHDHTKALLHRARLSVRDEYTKLLLSNHKIDGVCLTGCPAWYFLYDLDKPFSPPKEIKKIILSTPQKKLFFVQFEETVKAIQARFPDAELIITFNRGYQKDAFTSKKVSDYMSHYHDKFVAMGLECVDLSYDLETFESHIDADLHIGYRLHTHIYFLSRRKPSYLIAEDSRGAGHNYTLELGFFDGFSNMNRASTIQSILPGYKLRVNFQKFAERWYLNNDMAEHVIRCLEKDLASDFSRFHNVRSRMMHYFENMKSYLRSLP